jgi:hypothetical protein
LCVRYMCRGCGSAGRARFCTVLRVVVGLCSTAWRGTSVHAKHAHGEPCASLLSRFRPVYTSRPECGGEGGASGVPWAAGAAWRATCMVQCTRTLLLTHPPPPLHQPMPPARARTPAPAGRAGGQLVPGRSAPSHLPPMPCAWRSLSTGIPAAAIPACQMWIPSTRHMPAILGWATRPKWFGQGNGARTGVWRPSSVLYLKKLVSFIPPTYRTDTCTSRHSSRQGAVNCAVKRGP